jgi:hypothetical protein
MDLPWTVQDDKAPCALREYVRGLSLSIKKRGSSRAQTADSSSPTVGPFSQGGSRDTASAAVQKRRRSGTPEVGNLWLLQPVYITLHKGMTSWQSKLANTFSVIVLKVETEAG